LPFLLRWRIFVLIVVIAIFNFFFSFRPSGTSSRGYDLRHSTRNGISFASVQESGGLSDPFLVFMTVAACSRLKSVVSGSVGSRKSTWIVPRVYGQTPEAKEEQSEYLGERQTPSITATNNILPLAHQ
jgi:hypothetical protein